MRNGSEGVIVPDRMLVQSLSQVAGCGCKRANKGGDAGVVLPIHAAAREKARNRLCTRPRQQDATLGCPDRLANSNSSATNLTYQCISREVECGG